MRLGSSLQNRHIIFHEGREPTAGKPGGPPAESFRALKSYHLLPIYPKSEHKRTNNPGVSPEETKYSFMPIRALIVDDSSVMRKIVERSLRQAGIDLTEVLQAGNGAEALAVLKENRVDLILCDINMPVMDGLEFVKQLPGIENAKNVPVVMITTEGSEAHVVQALSCGARGYIRKPFTPEQVKEHIVPVLAAES
jgi:two-component system chemotaxis response regulator CheY